MKTQCKSISFAAINGNQLIAAQEKLNLGWRRGNRITFSFETGEKVLPVYVSLRNVPRTRGDLLEMLSTIIDDAEEEVPEFRSHIAERNVLIHSCSFDADAFGDQMWHVNIELAHQDGLAGMAIAGRA